MACTTRATSTTPAASHSWHGCARPLRTRSWPGRCARSSASSTAELRAPTPTPGTARASCSSSPTPSCEPRPASICRSRAATGLPSVSCHPVTQPRRCAFWRTRWRPRASRCSAGARFRSTRARAARPRARWPHGLRSYSWAPADDVADQDAFERKLYVIRRGVEHADLDDLAIPSFSSRTMVLKGMLTAPAAPALLPRPPRRARGEPPRPRALALLHEHLPELGAGPPVPDARPQRRDQHAARQPQLDASSRAAARLAGVRR